VRPRQELVYEPFSSDFGPLNLGKTYKYCIELERLIKNREYEGSKIYHYTTLAQNKRANSAVLIGAFQIIVLGRTADQAWMPFSDVPAFTDFRDASFGGCSYKCSIIDVLRGLEFGIKLRWFNFRTFDVSEYEHNEKVENGDFNWIIPGKFLAFSSPSPTSSDKEGWRTWTPEDYVPVFRRLGITTVIRLNNKTYDAERFTRLGIKHHDLYFLDGSCPSEAIIRRFLDITEGESGGIAVHCKAGLGRTGTLIGCYAMKHFNFRAADFIGWIRLCRPGSILGPQQQFLCEMESKCKRWGDEFRSTDRGVSYQLGSLEIGEEPKHSLEMSPRKV
jgi:cell division cycle 14